MVLRQSAAALVALAAISGSALASRGDLNTISHHTDAGSGFVSVATEVGIDKPKQLFLTIRVRPDVRVEVQWINRCRSGEGEREVAHKRFKTRSRRIELPIFYPRARDCLLYAEAVRDKPNSSVRVRLSMRVLADQRPAAAFRGLLSGN
jgi:hypothetical protein